MGKLVKYCSECEEGFAERFGFCPNCGGGLEAFELNPIAKSSETVADSNNLAQTEVSAPKAFEAPQPAETVAFVPETQEFSGDDILELESVDTRETPVEKEPETWAATAPAFSENIQDYNSETVAESTKFSKNDDDGGYHVTVVSEEASSWFKPFLLGLMAFAFAAAIGSYAIAIMIHRLDIPEIDVAESGFFLIDDEPFQTEEVKKKDNKEGGGGGGGGNENPDPVSKGRLLSHTDNPTKLLITPRMENPSLVSNNRIQNNIEREDTGEMAGSPNSLSNKISGGSGKGNGIGLGDGTGQGNGRGTGEGNGDGSGSGNGIGNGNGDGLGDGDNDRTPQVVKVQKPVGVTQKYRIISKPRANYTDAARQNNVQGTVTLKVTLLASGQVGSVTPVTNLPYGLTEKAIAAAKSITFEPSKKNGVATTTVATIQYSFTIY